jgi:hypothetical protein
MSPSTRTTAPAFAQTWSETDAAFLDPTSLPISKLPRPWDRKQETKLTVNGKQKKIWRRYTTRSGTSQVAPEEEEEEDVRDSRSRAVKKLQRMSPEAMEKSAKQHGNKNVFKATRWDRRKSVLPSMHSSYNSPEDD